MGGPAEFGLCMLKFIDNCNCNVKDKGIYAFTSVKVIIT